MAWLSGQIEQILRCGIVEPDDDFFDHGGDSMSATALFAAIEDRFGVALPLTTIYDAPSVTALAARIAIADTPATSCLVPIRPSSEPGAVILIHGIGGHVFDLMRLGGLIDTSLTVTALRAVGLEPGETPVTTVDAAADAFGDLIASRFAAQPVHLVGYSFGGIVAIELARRRLATGAPVGAVVLLDSYPHPRCWPRVQALDVRLRRIGNQARVLLAADWRTRLDYAAARLKTPSAKLPGASRVQWLAAPDDAAPEIRAVFDAASVAIDRYRPQFFDHPVTFIKPLLPSTFLPTNPRAVWRATLPGLEIRTVSGDHVTMLEAHAGEVAAVVSHLVAMPR